MRGRAQPTGQPLGCRCRGPLCFATMTQSRLALFVAEDRSSLPRGPRAETKSCPAMAAVASGTGPGATSRSHSPHVCSNRALVAAEFVRLPVFHREAEHAELAVLADLELREAE